MKQQHLPGMELTEDERQAIKLQAKLEKTYVCRRCHCPEKSVAWEPRTQAFVCFWCSQVDVKRTREVSR